MRSALWPQFEWDTKYTATLVAVLGISASSQAQLIAEIDSLGTNLLTVTEAPSGAHPLGTDAVGYDVFRQRPVLQRADWAVLVWRALTMRNDVARTADRPDRESA